MASVRYMGGGSAATLGTKNIDENGIYNASDDDLDGYSQVTVEVPEPSGTVSLSYNANGIYADVDVKEYEEATIEVNVPEPSTQSKTVTATTTQQTVTPDAGYLLDEVVVNPQQNAGTYTPTPNTAANDMGPVNSYRYVNTSGMIQPTGTKTISIDSNGEYAEGVTSYDNVAITVDVPVSGTLGTKNIITNGLYKAIDDDYDGYSEVNVNVPQNATLGIKTITTNGNYYATTDGYDGYSRVDVSVAGSTLQANKNVTATTSQQIVTPDVGYDALEQVTVNPQVHTQTYTPAQNTAANDMGEQNNYRYVNTSGMVVPGSVTPSNSTPAALTSGSAVTPTANGYAVSSIIDVSTQTPSVTQPGNILRTLDAGYYVWIDGYITPSSTPEAISNGELIEFLGAGEVVDSITSVTPSSTPTSVSSGDNIHIGGSGVIVDSVPTPTSITPSNASPVYMDVDSVYQTVGNGGYAISSYSSKAPSDSSPSSIPSGTFVKNAGSSTGYLYASLGLGKCKAGTATASSSVNTKVTLGFKPKYLCVLNASALNARNIVYDETISTTNFAMSTSSSNCAITALGTTSSYRLYSIDNDGFTLTKWNNNTIHYFAIG